MLMHINNSIQKLQTCKPASDSNCMCITYILLMVLNFVHAVFFSNVFIVSSFYVDMCSRQKEQCSCHKLNITYCMMWYVLYMLWCETVSYCYEEPESKGNLMKITISILVLAHTVSVCKKLNTYGISSLFYWYMGKCSWSLCSCGGLVDCMLNKTFHMTQWECILHLFMKETVVLCIPKCILYHTSSSSVKTFLTNIYI